jgi:hypothetical protein
MARSYLVGAVRTHFLDGNLEHPSVGAPRPTHVVSVVFALAVAALLALFALSRLPHRPTQGELAVAALDERVEVLALGASHVYANIEPKLTGMRWANLSAGLMNYTYMEGVLAAHEAKLDGLRAVVVDVDPLPVYMDSYATARGDFAHLLDLSPNLSALREPWTRRVALMRERLMTRQLPARRAFSREKLTAERLFRIRRGEEHKFEAVAGHERLTGHPPGSPKWGARAAAHFKAYAPDVIERNLAAFEGIVRRVQARKIPLLLVRFPTHPAYLEAAPPEFAQAYQRLIDTARRVAPEAELVDYSRAPFADDEFYDDDHLNQLGVERFTPMLAQRVRTLLSR